MVFDDAVVDDRDAATEREVGVCVRVRGRAVRRPPRVPDGGRCGGQRRFGDRGGEAFELARLLRGGDAFEVVGDERNTRRVVTPVLKSGEAAHDNALRALIRRAGAHVSDDSTHRQESTVASRSHPPASPCRRGGPSDAEQWWRELCPPCDR
ncbi:hypothetical protein GCM10025876_24700 [Demequina litorisediminis]|uniref:Uncharacterized protein n=1 Tax=Demequina litorisediminis TaxID=1849022 RepID=A0ABQ6IEW8_9MICO|nr:hypothetical protein GCM10025876_24700 [Demequina litorisediminis]